MDLQFNKPIRSPNFYSGQTPLVTSSGLVVALEHRDLPLARLPLGNQGSFVKGSSERELQKRNDFGRGCLEKRVPSTVVFVIRKMIFGKLLLGSMIFLGGKELFLLLHQGICRNSWP